MEGRKVLVTGAAGHLALPVVRELAKRNEVWGLARFSRSEDRELLEALGVTCIRHDLGTDPLDDVPTDFDHVLHAGAFVNQAEDAMAETMAVNVQGTARLLDHCRPSRSFVFCSSGSVYAPQAGPVTEDAEFGLPVPAYSLSKIAAEQLVTYLANALGVPTIILRIGFVYGGGLYGGLETRFRRMLEGKEIWVSPVEPVRGSMLWVDDAVRLMITAFDRAAVPPVVVNFTGDDPVGIEESCRFAGELLGVEPRFRVTEAAYPPLFRLDTTKMHAVLGYPEVGWREGFRRVLERSFPDRVRPAGRTGAP